MKIAKLNAIKVSEGKASIYVPSDSFTDPHHCMVFFNPVMEFSRTISSIALQALKPRLPSNPKILDGLCSTGARGVRYYLEVGKSRVTFNDANELAIAYAKKNAQLNKLKGASYSSKDFFVEAATSHDYDIVELDPFGTPTLFLDSAIRACAKNAVISVTATDLANLCGARPKPCMREYDAAPSHNYYCHETALRILIGRVVRSAAVHANGFTPLVSFYSGHHIKTIGTLTTSAKAADEAYSKVGMLGFCRKCFAFYEKTGTCKSCKAPLERCGPLWLGKLGSGETLSSMLAISEKSKYATPAHTAFIKLLLEENQFAPGYLDIHELCSANHKPVGKKIDVTIDELRKKGFNVSRTHFAPTGLKTDASAADLLKASCG
ncbi:MAG: methyltransferase [Candidatus Micrarchaeia archaeon]|jgi:tRNA (guanine26-N2/guanine27-N2)-dimethyltransferase